MSATKAGTAPAPAEANTPSLLFEGQVEAVRQTVLAAQVAGSVQQLTAKVGQAVAAGQTLLRIDARAAEQGAHAAQANAQAAQAAMALAAQDLERKRQLQAKQYISKAALEQAQASYDAARANLDAARAQTGVAQVQTGFYVVRAPYAGMLSAVSVEVGDLAAPGRPLLSLYDPAALRVTVAVPAELAATAPQNVRVRFPGTALDAIDVPASAIQILPTVDAETLTRQVRVALPARLGPAVVPGLFARIDWPGSTSRQGTEAAGGRVRVPLKAVVHRGELTAVYIKGGSGQAMLRQVRLARPQDGWVEVLSGVQPGETVVEDAATALRKP